MATKGRLVVTHDQIAEFVRSHARVFAISGAGLSTASGIPDYRDEAREWKRPPPVQLQTFLASTNARSRYWARSFVGWPTFAAAEPNRAHRALVKLEVAGYLKILVTQNVDRLHQQAGHQNVVDLHGRLDRVVCMRCGALTTRADLQDWLAHENQGFEVARARLAPDGDADIDDVDTSAFRYPDCFRCGGILKPDVVFFGENVPRAVVSRSMAALEQSTALLLLGTSASPYSCFRYCRRAHELGKPIAIINIGQTRADDLAAVTASDDVGRVLESISKALV